MKCVILAAGEGKRMHPLTFTRPKVMLPVANKPLLEWNILNAIKAGFKEFIFIVGYKSEMVRTYFQDGKKWKVKIDYINQGKPFGTAHAIGMVEKFTGKNFIVLSGDTIVGEKDIQKITKKENSIGLYKVDNPQNYGIVETKNNKVIKIYEKMKQPVSNVINAGVYHFNQNIFSFIKQTKLSPRGEYEITDSINLLAKNRKIEPIMIEDWKDIVYPWHLLDVNTGLIKNIVKNIGGKVEKNTRLKGDILIGENTVVMDGSYIEGPVVIGKDCKIGPNCYIRPYTSIGNGCHVGNACEIKNSIIMDHTNVPHHNYVGDSVIGQNCNLGSGTKIANLRLDKKSINTTLNDEHVDTKKRKLGVIMGDNVQTGINSMINAGSLIGNNVFIGMGSVVEGEIKTNARIL